MLSGLAGAALIGGAASLFSSGVGAISSNNNIDKQIAAQQQENQKNRAWNLMLAEKQNSWNIDQWNRENEYNLPVNQINRLQEAGLNPDLMYQNGANGLTSASSPQMTAGAPSSPVDMSNIANKKTVGDVMMSTLNAMNIARQNQKLEADTKGQQISNSYADVLARQSIQLNDVTIKLTEKDKDLKESEIKVYEERAKEIQSNIDSLKQNIRESMSRCEFMSEQKLQLGWQRYIGSKQFELSCDNFRLEVEKLGITKKLTNAQIAFLAQQVIESSTNISLNTMKTSSLIDTNCALQDFYNANTHNIEVSTKLLPTSTGVKNVTSIIGALGSLVVGGLGAAKFFGTKALVPPTMKATQKYDYPDSQNWFN